MRSAVPRGVRIRKLFSSRRARYGSNATVLTVAVVAIVLMVNFMVARHPGKIDLTQNKMYTLSEATRNVVRAVDRNVKITAFFPEGDAIGELVRDLLKEYARLSSRIAVEFVDPDKNPSLAKQYEITAYGTSVVEAGTKSRKVMEYDLVEYQGESETPGFAGEQAFTRALIGVLQGEEKKVCFLSGHDERDLVQDYWQARSFLEGEGYATDTVNLAVEGKVPQGVSLLVLAGPRKDLAAKETQALEAYLGEGGRLMVLAGPLGRRGDLPNLKAMLAKWGVGLDDDVVIDPESHYFLDAASPIPEARNHDITGKLIHEKLGTVLPRSRSLHRSEGPAESELTVSALLVTTDKSWGETDLAAKQVSFDAKDDIKGPLTLAFAVERTITEPQQGAAGGGTKAQESDEAAPGGGSGDQPGGPETAMRQARVLVIGNAGFLDNDVVTFQGNIDFFMNSVAWLVSKAESMAIRAKSPSFEQVYLSGGQASFVFYSTVVALPLLLLLVGGGVWFRRRNL